MLLPLLLLANTVRAEPWFLMVGGDIMLNGIKVAAEPLAALSPYFRQADLVAANLEIPLTNGNAKTSNKSAQEIKRKDQYVLKADIAHAANLAKAGIKIVSLGNNHAMDYGAEGLEQMTYLLSHNNIAYCGAGKDYALAVQPATAQAGKSPVVSGLSFLAFKTPAALRKCTPARTDRAGVAVLSFGGVIGTKAREALRAHIAKARAIGTFVMVFLHWGTELKTMPDSYQVSLGRAWIDEGADIVVGSHPHVLQGAEIYRGKPIFYSMGNLISPRPGSTGLARIGWNDDGLGSIEWLPVTIANGRCTPVAVSKRAASTEAFLKLCRALRAKYPNPDSELPRLLPMPDPPTLTPPPQD